MCNIESIYTDKGIPPLGHYSQAIKANGFIFLSGQIPAKVVENDVKVVSSSVSEQAHTMLKNAETVLEAAGSSLGKVVRSTVYLADITKDFEEFNQVYAEYFPQRPARSCFEFPKLPPGMRMEIDLIAVE